MSTAFWNGDIDVDALVSWDDVVYKLRKILNGLKQFSRLWYEKLTRVLQRFQFKQISSRECGSRCKTIRVISLVYVDGHIILGSKLSGLKWVKDRLCFLIRIKDLDELRYYLNVAFESNGNVMRLHQAAYCKRVLERYGMSSAKKVSTWMVKDLNNLFMKGSIIEVRQTCAAKVPYKKLTGSLFYLSTHIRPDITFSVTFLSRFTKALLQMHLIAARNILRYLTGTMGH